MAAVAAAVGGNTHVTDRIRKRKEAVDKRSIDLASCSTNSRDSHMSLHLASRRVIRHASQREVLRRGASADSLVEPFQRRAAEDTSMSTNSIDAHDLLRWMDVELKGRLQEIDAKLEKMLQGQIHRLQGQADQDPRHWNLPNGNGNLGLGNRRIQNLMPMHPSVSPRTRAALASASSSKANPGLNVQKCTAGDQLPAGTPSERSEDSDQEPVDRKNTHKSKASSQSKTSSDTSKKTVEKRISGNAEEQYPSHNEEQYPSHNENDIGSAMITQSFQNILGMTPQQYKEWKSNRSAPDRPERITPPTVSEDDKMCEDVGDLPARSTQRSEAAVTPSGSVRSMKSAASERLSRTSRIARQILFAFDDPETNWIAERYARAMCTLLLLSVPFSLSQTYERTPVNGLAPAVIEIFIDTLLSLEVVSRFLLSPDKFIFVTNENNILDLFAALPAISVRIAVGVILPEEPTDFPEGVFLLGFVPVLRLLKLIRHLKKFHLLVMSCRLALEALPTLLFALLVLTLAFAPVIFMVESRDNIPTLPKAIWLTIVTMTTVGYGDTTPKTNAGSIVVGTLVISSVLFMAMPLGIIGQAFNEIWQDRDRILLARGTRERLVQWGYSAQDIPHLFEGYGDGSGELGMEEFVDMIQKLQIGLSDERIIGLFQTFDEDQSGSIDAKEFVRLLFPKEYFRMYESEDEK